MNLTRVFLSSAVFYSLCGALFAATVVLKTGRRMEGEVKSETDTEVVLKISYGEVKLKRSKIERIINGDASSYRSTVKEGYTKSHTAPDELKELDKEMRSLKKAHESMRSSQSSIRRGTRVIKEKTKELNALTSKVNAANAVLAKSDTTDVQAHNAIVSKYNKMVTQQRTLAAEVQKIQLSIKKHAKKVSAYLSQRNEARANIIDAKRLAKQKPELIGPLLKIEEIFLRTEGDLVSDQIDYASSGNTMMVDVLINDRETAKLIFDTGASHVMLTKQFAEKLGIGARAGVSVKNILADGSVSNSRGIILKSVQVGDSKVPNVIATITENKDGNLGADGLLGMSFLKEFNVELDPVSKKLVLRKFRD